VYVALTAKGFSPHGRVFSVTLVQKLATFFKNVIFEKLESQFTIIQNTDIVN